MCDSYTIYHRKTCAAIYSTAAANIREAVLAAVAEEVSLSEATLRYADLSRANLSRADLRYADLRGANLSGADLARANLRYADLAKANLSKADLSGADLSKADLSVANLSEIREDFRAVLDAAPVEVPALLVALREGRIDGTTYEGECSCLIGTIATTRGVDHRALGDLRPDADRPAERWALAIRRGDTPENSQSARILEGWIVEWLAERGA